MTDDEISEFVSEFIDNAPDKYVEWDVWSGNSLNYNGAIAMAKEIIKITEDKINQNG